MDASDEHTRAPRRVVTIPNLLSAVRLATVPLFVWLFVSGHTGAAVILLGATAWTDFFDGYIARRTNSVTELGKILDPLADRVFIAALALALVGRGALPLVLVGAVVGRDVLILALYPVVQRGRAVRITVNDVGKTATALLLVGLTSLAVGETSFPGAAWVGTPGLVLVMMGAVLYWVSGAMYARQALAPAGSEGGRE